MHRTEGLNFTKDANGNNVFTNGPPATTIEDKWLNAVQEEICNVITHGGLEIRDANTDSVHTQLRDAIINFAGVFSTVIASQLAFNNCIERVAANQYKIKDTYTSLYLRYVTGGYACFGSNSFLDGGDTWGYLDTNNCKLIQFENGAYLNAGDTPFYLRITGVGCGLIFPSIKGLGVSDAAVQYSYYIATTGVRLLMPKVTDRYTNTDYVSFYSTTQDDEQNIVAPIINNITETGGSIRRFYQCINVVNFYRYNEETDDIDLDSNQRYTMTGIGKTMTLPDTANIGDVIDIFAENQVNVLQGDSENTIEYLNKYFTTKGTDGYFILPSKTYAKLIYGGNKGIRVEPGVKLSNPADLPTGNGNGCSFSPDGIYLAVSHDTTPFITIYKRSGDTFTKLSNPADLPAGNAYGCSFSPDGIYLAVSHTTTPFITIYKRSGDTFTKLSDPADLPSDTGFNCSFSPDGVYLVVTHSITPFITIYKRSGDTFTKLSNPADLPGSTSRECSFSPDGVYLSIAHLATPFITIYKRSGDTFTKLSNPADLPSDTAYGCSFSPDGIYLAVSHDTTPFVTIYKRSGDTFTKLSDPADLPSGNSRKCSFSPDGIYLAVSHTTTPFVTIYKRSGDTFTKLSDPADLPASYSYGCPFSSDGVYLAVSHTTTPFITIYKNLGTAEKVWFVAQLNTLYSNEEYIENLFK